MLQDYKYGLTFENTMQDGYVTEKIVSPFFTNAIPIYYGSEAIFDIINADSFFYLKTLEDFEKLLTLYVDLSFVVMVD